MNCSANDYPPYDRPTCDAILAFSQDAAKRPIPCHQMVGLRPLRDASGETRHYCAAEGHKYRVQRRYGVAQAVTA